MSIKKNVIPTVAQNGDGTPDTSRTNGEKDDFDVVGMTAPLAPFGGKRSHVAIESDETGKKELREAQGHVEAPVHLARGPLEEWSEGVP